jgi:hypothetical protein
MKGDFTRETFDPAHRYTAVLMQQGRVQLDADWNEQAAIARYRARAALADLIGPHGGPAAYCGYAVIATAAEVDKLTGRDGRQLSAARREALKKALLKGDLVLGAGRYYVNGLMAENDAPFLYGEQAGYPFSAGTGIEILTGAAQVLLYLDVWERYVGYLDDDRIREVALGEADTAGRVQLVAQVKAVAGPRLPVELPHADPSMALLRALARQPETQQDACVLHAEARYRGLENQLYRVEIHRGGPAGGADGATFKWSRENGSVVLPVLSAIPADGTITVTLAALPRDDKLGLAAGNWVELFDDDSVLQQRADRLLQVRSVDGVVVTLDGPADRLPGTTASHPMLRRWDHDAADLDGGAIRVVESVGANGWIELEEGVQVQFVPAGQNEKPIDYHSGDYWLIPARTATGDVEWPQENGERAALPPSGVRHYLAPLAALKRNAGAGGWTVEERRLTFKGIAA